MGLPEASTGCLDTYSYSAVRATAEARGASRPFPLFKSPSSRGENQQTGCLSEKES